MIWDICLATEVCCQNILRTALRLKTENEVEQTLLIIVRIILV